MARPSTSLASLRPDLEGGLIEFDLLADQKNFIGLKVAPVFETELAAGTFGKIPVKELLKQRDTARAPGAGYNRDTLKFEKASYATAEEGAEEVIDDNDAATYKHYFDYELIQSIRAQDALLRGLEQEVADLCFNPTTFAGATKFKSVTNEWDDYEAATPIDDVQAGKIAIWERCGIWPNKLIITRLTFMHLRRCEQIKEEIRSSGAGQSTEPGKVTAAMLAQCFDLEEILVAGGTKNTAAEGQEAVFDHIWDPEYAMLAGIFPSPDLRRPTLARTYHWDGDGSRISGRVETYRDEARRGDIARVRHQRGVEMFYEQLGFLFGNVTTIA